MSALKSSTLTRTDLELVCDSTGTSMQVAAVLVLETPSRVGLATVREAIADRITAVPRSMSSPTTSPSPS